MYLDSRRARRFEAKNLAFYDGLVVSNEEDRRQYVATFGFPDDRIFVASPGVDIDYWSALPRQPESPSAIVFVGDLEVPSNPRAVRTLLREVLPRVRRRFPDAQCWIVNPGSSVALSVEQDARTQILHRVEDVRPYLTRATVACLPLIESEDSAILEIMAAGVPVVCTPSAVEGLELQPGVHCLCAERAEELAASVEMLLRDPVRAEGMAVAARERVARQRAGGADLDELRSWLERLAGQPRRCAVGAPVMNAVAPGGSETSATKAA